MARKSRIVAEFGDFQTPPTLAADVMKALRDLQLNPASILEPSCGKGAFLFAAAKAFPRAKLFGLDINPKHLAEAKLLLSRQRSRVTLKKGDFFKEDWAALLDSLPKPVFVVGNPPWVTNSELGTFGSANVPEKRNHFRLKGLDALTGKSNFDISEWMLLKNIEWIVQTRGVLALLCKISVARKVIAKAWQLSLPVTDARLHRIDAMFHFGAAVDACLCVIRADGTSDKKQCPIYPSLSSAVPESILGYRDNLLVSDALRYDANRHLSGGSVAHKWRSGLKHDCSKVMELNGESIGRLRNGHGDQISLERKFVFPLIKSSDIGGTSVREMAKWVIVPQRHIGEETRTIRKTAPKTWRYLESHSEAFAARGSTIYSGKPPYSIFGIGEYSFAPWKVAISGLYKKFEFKIFGPRHGKPVMFDDTVYFLPFANEADAKRALSALRSKPALEFLTSMVFWDEKRPITADLLKRLNLELLLSGPGDRKTEKKPAEQLSLFEKPDAGISRPSLGKRSQTRKPAVSSRSTTPELRQRRQA